ncbi:MAG: hypothetical protein WAM28_08040 [Chlamydiales bacterium]
MQLLESIIRLLSRFRYPVSLPEDVARDLGLFLPNTLGFRDFLRLLASPHHRCARLHKYISRHRAEAVFESALQTEKFKSCTLISYYFNKGWLVFTLHFDEQMLLTRISIQCPACERIEGFDLPLDEKPALAKLSHF